MVNGPEDNRIKFESRIYVGGEHFFDLAARRPDGFWIELVLNK